MKAAATEEADGIVKGDPFVAGGAIASWKVRPFACWSAQESRGQRSCEEVEHTAAGSSGLAGARRTCRSSAVLSPSTARRGSEL